MTYQKVTGCLSQGAHPGSYNGQDAYNDMLVVDDGICNAKNRRVQTERSSINTFASDVQERNRFNSRGGTEQVDELNGKIAGTLDASYYKGCGERQGIERDVVCMSDRKGHNGITEDGTATTLTAQEKERPVVGTSIVRRLTPMECERLQGFPDNWSKYGMDENGKVYELSDSARYRLQGNSIARPFWTWMLRRIAAQYERPATLGSLFDGQAGFPLCWAEVGGIPVWSSEIDRNPQAVARYHFPEDET